MIVEANGHAIDAESLVIRTEHKTIEVTRDSARWLKATIKDNHGTDTAYPIFIPLW